MILNFSRYFFFYRNEHLQNKQKSNSHMAPRLLWVPGIKKKLLNVKIKILKIVKL